MADGMGALGFEDVCMVLALEQKFALEDAICLKRLCSV
jgi:hypothetical protein